MNTTEIRIAMAELEGFTDIKIDDCEHVDIDARSVSEWQELRGTVDGKRKGVRDYPNDLNAVHRVEMGMPSSLFITWSQNLIGTVNRDSSGSELDMLDVCEPVEVTGYVARATARQRCEAILRTVGKWKESAA
jgi:hypothetical protein